MEATCSEIVSSSSCSESEEPVSKRSRKLSGAATYRTKFNRAWTKDYPFISSVQNDPYRQVDSHSVILELILVQNV